MGYGMLLQYNTKGGTRYVKQMKWTGSKPVSNTSSLPFFARRTQGFSFRRLSPSWATSKRPCGRKRE
eukprot:scaffold8888_cov161-Amphora_coffeaeformis.AAC.3